MREITLSIIIVSYNVREFLWQALTSIEKAVIDLDHEIIVVDNASYDGSITLVQKYFPNVKTIANSENLGFARANNQGIIASRGKFVCLINPDTLVQEDTFNTIIEFLKIRPDVGMVGCKVLNPDGSLQLACRRSYPTPWIAFTRISGLSYLFPKSKLFGRYNLTFLDPDHIAEVEAISGSFMVVRRETIEQVGMLDETFFMYGEDLDWCFRIRQSGYKIIYLPVTQIIHFKGESSRKSEFDQLRLFYKAMRLFVRMHFSKGRALFPTVFLQIAIWIRAGISLIGQVLHRLTLPFFDFCLIYLSLPLSLLLRFGHISFIRSYFFVWFLYSLFWIISLSMFGLYGRKRFSGAFAFSAIFAGLVINSGFTFFFNQYAFSRAVVLIAGVLNLFLIPGWRLIIKLLSRMGFSPFTSSKGRSLLRQRSIIVGDLNSAEDLVSKLNGRIDSQYDIRGIVTTETVTPDSPKSRILGTVDSLDRIVTQERIQEVIFSTDQMSYDKILFIISHVQRPGLYYKLVPSNLEVIVGKASIERLDDIPLLDIDYNLHKLNFKFIKRISDIFLAFTGLTLTWPVILFMRCLKRKKLMSYAIKGTGSKVLLLSTFEAPDQNVIWWNKLPLFLEVLSGKISIVGKEMVLATGNDIDHKSSAPDLKPGLTGLAQINAKATMSEEEKEKYNIYYMKNYSPVLDLEIIFKTIFRV